MKSGINESISPWLVDLVSTGASTDGDLTSSTTSSSTTSKLSRPSRFVLTISARASFAAFLFVAAVSASLSASKR